MTKILIEILGREDITDEQVKKAILDANSKHLDESDLFVQGIDDEVFEHQIDEWLKANGLLQEN